MTPQARAWLTWWKLAGFPQYIPEARLRDVPEAAFDAVFAHHGPGWDWWRRGFACETTKHGAHVMLFRNRRGQYTVQADTFEKGEPVKKAACATLASARVFVAQMLEGGL